MKTNWGALSITIAVVFLAVSVLTAGLMAGRRVSKLEQKLEQQIAILRTSIKQEGIAQGYAFSKAESEKRAITLTDLHEGYELAKKLVQTAIITE